MAAAPLSSPPPRAVGGKNNIFWSGDCPAWAAAVLANDEQDSSPVLALNFIASARADLTKSSGRLSRSAGIALATAGHFNDLLNVEDAKVAPGLRQGHRLKFVAAKDRTAGPKNEGLVS